MSKVKYIPQSEHSECGLAAVTSVLNYFSINVQIDSLRERFGSVKGGLSFENICYILNDYGIHYKGVRILDISYFKDIKQPSILLWESDHFVVIYKYRFRHFYIMDPKSGLLTLSENDFKSKFSNMSLVYNNSAPSSRVNSSCDYEKKNIIRELVVTNKWRVFGLILFILLLKFFSLLLPILTQRIVDNYQLIFDYDPTSILGILMVFSLTYYFLSTGYSLMLNKVRLNWTDYLSSRFIKKVFNKTLIFFVNRSSGTMIYKANLISMIQQMLSTNIVENFIDYIFMIVYFIFLLNYSHILTGIVLLFCGFVSFTSYFYSMKNKKITDTIIDVQSDLQKSYLDIFNGIETVKALGKEKYFIKKWGDVFNKSLRIQSKQGVYSAWLTNISNTILFVLPLFIIFFGVQEITKETLTIGQLVGFLALTSNFIEPFSSFLGAISQLMILKSYLAQIYEVTETKTFIEYDGCNELDSMEELELSNVSFSFGKFEDNVISDVDLRIEHGEKVAIVGKSGSGKSTLLKLISGLYQSTEGKIQINKLDISDFSKRSLREKFGYVTQDSLVFGDSFTENLFLDHFEENPNTAEILQTTGVIEISSNRLQTMVSEDGKNISGGQKQKIAIARCLLKNPEVIILDEPTSALDNISEREILRYIFNLQSTVIIVAHRLNTIKHMERILVMDHGSIVEEGNHEELIDKKGYYYQLYKET
ncbi:peptidase domain-containing ABC transporter (plasmid) [Enterococcus avium]